MLPLQEQFAGLSLPSILSKPFYTTSWHFLHDNILGTQIKQCSQATQCKSRQETQVFCTLVQCSKHKWIHLPSAFPLRPEIIRSAFQDLCIRCFSTWPRNTNQKQSSRSAAVCGPTGSRKPPALMEIKQKHAETGIIFFFCSVFLKTHFFMK